MAPLKRFATLCLAMGMALPCVARGEDAPGTFKIPGTDTTVRVYGYAQLDMTYDLQGRPPDVEGFDWATQAAIIPLDKSWETRNKPTQLYMTARTSRFGMESTTPTRAGVVGVKLEGDFNGPDTLWGQSYTNSVFFRLRQGYGTITGGYGSFLAGQTWSTFLDLGSYPDVVDFNGPGTIPLLRQPMLRYTTPAMYGFTLSVAAENAPGTDGDDFCYGDGSGAAAVASLSCGPNGISKFQQYPDFIASLNTSGAWGHLTVAGVTRNIRFAAGSPSVASSFGASPIDKQGFGAAASGSFKVMGDTLVWHVEGGSLGRYMMNAVGNGGVAGAVVTSAGDIAMWDAIAYHVGYTHVWSPAFRSNLVWAQTFFKPNTAGGYDASADSNANQRIDQAFVNTFWTVARNAEIGLEYAYGQRRTFASAANPMQEGTMHRINTTFHYNFF